MEDRKLKHAEEKNPKNGEARDQRWKIAKRAAVGTAIVAAFLMGKCMSEPPMQEVSTEKFDLVECEVEKGEHKDICGNGKTDKGVFVAFVRVEEGKEGKSAVYRFAKVEIDECDKTSPAFCEEDCKTKKSKKKTKPVARRRGKRTKVASLGKLLPLCSEERINKSTLSSLRGRVTDEVMGNKGALRKNLQCPKPKEMVFVVRAKVGRRGESNIYGASVKCDAQPVGNSATILGNMQLELGDLPSMGLFEEPCRIDIGVKVRK